MAAGVIAEGGGAGFLGTLSQAVVEVSIAVGRELHVGDAHESAGRAARAKRVAVNDFMVWRLGSVTSLVIG